MKKAVSLDPWRLLREDWELLIRYILDFALPPIFFDEDSRRETFGARALLRGRCRAFSRHTLLKRNRRLCDTTRSTTGGVTMGEVIRRTASPVDIIADVRATLTNAAARGGVWKELAEERLSGLMAVVDDVEARFARAESDLTPLQAALDAKDVEADRMLGRVSDEIWNEVGRPALDPALSILFPGGIAYYAGGDVEGQPDRMDLLAELLEASLHPRLPPAQAKGHAREVRAAAKTLRAAVDLARPARARLELLDRVRRALATGAQVELSSLKRLYKVERFSESDIHAVIPDRPPTVRKAAPTLTLVDGPGLPPDGTPSSPAPAGA